MSTAEEQPIQPTSTPGISGNRHTVNSVEELLTALGLPHVSEIEITRDLEGLPQLRLSPGQTLSGSREARPFLAFAQGNDGIELTADNSLSHLRLRVEPHKCAIKNAANFERFGRVLLEDVETIGRVKILVEAQHGKAHLEVRGLHIEGADASQETDQPSGYGVSVVQGAFTLWNKRSSQQTPMTADLLDISTGRLDAPVLGSGVFLCGADHADFSLRVQRLRTNAIYSQGRIANGTADRISGGVFVAHGAIVDTVENCGPVMTFGPNDMALDSWGSVDRWIAREKVTTFGESAIGFVNFGQLGLLSMRAPIETHGTGARGFNVYSGTVLQAEFDRVETHGDGAVAVQISRPVGTIGVRRGIETHGGRGKSLVKGVIQELKATALSVRPGGTAQEVCISGGLRTRGSDILALENAGVIGRLTIEGGFGDSGEGGGSSENHCEK